MRFRSTKTTRVQTLTRIPRIPGIRMSRMTCRRTNRTEARSRFRMCTAPQRRVNRYDRRRSTSFAMPIPTLTRRIRPKTMPMKTTPRTWRSSLWRKTRPAKIPTTPTTRSRTHPHDRRVRLRTTCRASDGRRPAPACRRCAVSRTLPDGIPAFRESTRPCNPRPAGCSQRPRRSLPPRPRPLWRRCSNGYGLCRPSDRGTRGTHSRRADK